MKVLGIYGSPRAQGNSDLLLDQALEGARSAGGETDSIYVRDLKIAGCRECGGCNRTGKCVVQDDMQKVYPKIQEAGIIILSSPIFFYGLSSQVKTLIDRCQALWSARMLQKTEKQRKTHERGRGYLIAVGATRGKNLFDGVQLTARYFFDALDMSYEGGIFFRRVEGKGAIAEQPEALKQAFEFGRSLVMGKPIPVNGNP